MQWTRGAWTMLAGLAGLLAVGAGAFAAHGMDDPDAVRWLQTGALYSFVHALATLICPSLVSRGARTARYAPGFFLAGVALFSGSLYFMALGGPSWLGAVAPIGGVSFMIGWGIVAFSALALDRR